MEQLLEQSARLLKLTSVKYERSLVHQMHWKSRLIGLTGARGTGKSTLLLQWLKQQRLPAQVAAYFSLDDLYFTAHDLKTLLFDFYKQGGRIAVLDEVHRVQHWAQAVKNAYDFLPDLQLIFTGSSVIDIKREAADLSRRAVLYSLPGLSYREYLNWKHGIDLPTLSFQELTSNKKDWWQQLPADFRPYAFFSDYLEQGYYPFSFGDEAGFPRKVQQMVRMVIESDLAALPGFDGRGARKLLHLLYIIAEQVPFKPNITALAEKTGIHRNSLTNYLQHLAEAELITLLYGGGSSVAALQKPDKIYLQNPNLMHQLAPARVNVGTVRETFVVNQLAPAHKVEHAIKGDLFVDGRWTLEIGGPKKGKAQIAAMEDAFVVRDLLEYPHANNLPLWAFGMLY